MCMYINMFSPAAEIISPPDSAEGAGALPALLQQDSHVALGDIFPSWHFQMRLLVFKPISIPEYVCVQFYCINFRNILPS